MPAYMKLPKTGAGCSETVARRDNTKPKLCSPCPVSDVDLLQRGEPSLLAEKKKQEKERNAEEKKKKKKTCICTLHTTVCTGTFIPVSSIHRSVFCKPTRHPLSLFLCVFVVIPFHPSV